MIKIFKSKNWKIFDGTRDEAVKYIMDYLEDMDYMDCDTCWDDYVELYDSDTDEITVFGAYYSGWDYSGEGGKLYPVEIEIDTKEAFKKMLSGNYSNRDWTVYLTKLDPRKDYIIV